MMRRLPRCRPPLVLPNHAKQAVCIALMSAAHRSGVYPPLIAPLMEQGLIQPGSKGGPPVPTSAGRAALESARRPK